MIVDPRSLKQKPPRFSQEQILWIQGWLEKVERDCAIDPHGTTAIETLRYDLFQMKRECELLKESPGEKDKLKLWP